ncbi:Cold-responsive protein kinase 1 [Linum perenne]
MENVLRSLKKKILRADGRRRRSTTSSRSSKSSSSFFSKCFSSSSSSSSSDHQLPTTTTDDRRSQHSSVSASAGNISGLENVMENVDAFTFKELDMATNRFDASNRIGEGGFGSVYKGRLKDGRVVAIKVLSAGSRQGDREFMSELATLSNITHHNLVHLLGGCVDGPRRLLVYDYMENGNLFHNLLDQKSRSTSCYISKLITTWEVRKEIAIGIAAGLAYLHEDVNPHIVHRDIKATNILLDRNLRPKISDFGLSKFFPEGITHITTRVAGTLGYLAPEYAISGHLTRKLDVYSFGVLLLEIISGRTAVDFDQTLGEQYFLVEKAYQLYKSEQLIQLVDPTLIVSDSDISEAERFLRIALLCLQEKSSMRPTMSAALKMMRKDSAMTEEEIAEPGLIADFMTVKINRKQDRRRQDSTPNSAPATPPRVRSSPLRDSQQHF